MPSLTPEGQRLVDELAQRHGFSTQAVTEMLTAIIAGQGRMAQFGHGEFGGNGQWMAGGMLMIGDMFNNGLKSRVSALCSDLSNALAAAGPLAAPAQSQSQSQGGNSTAHLPETPFLRPSPGSSWWPQELGAPASTGSQNSMRYAWFANAHRLVIEHNDETTVYDTLDHQISGFSQQQGHGDDISMSSQHGTIDLATLPILFRNGEPPESSSAVPIQQAQKTDSTNEPDDITSDAPLIEPGESNTDTSLSQSGKKPGATTLSAPADVPREDPLQLIERLGELRDRGVLTDEEFAAKKSELLARL